VLKGAIISAKAILKEHGDVVDVMAWLYYFCFGMTAQRGETRSQERILEPANGIDALRILKRVFESYDALFTELFRLPLQYIPTRHIRRWSQEGRDKHRKSHRQINLRDLSHVVAVSFHRSSIKLDKVRHSKRSPAAEKTLAYEFESAASGCDDYHYYQVNEEVSLSS
jgi:hypothetical protein